MSQKALNASDQGLKKESPQVPAIFGPMAIPLQGPFL